MEIESGSGKNGLKSVVADLHDPAQPPPGAEEHEQMPLLPLEGAGVGAEEGAVPRGPGRPPGARNKSTEEWRKYLAARYRNPLEALAQTYCMPIEELARRLGLVSKPTFEQALELFKLQLTAARDLAPYTNKKMPMEVDAGGGGVFQLVINNGAAAAQGVPDAEAQAFKFLNTPIEENQLLTDADFKESNETESNENG